MRTFVGRIEFTRIMWDANSANRARINAVTPDFVSFES